MSASEQVSFAPTLSRAETIARLNDKLRKEGLGGQVLVTRGVADLPGFETATLSRALAAYDAFDEYNDPHGERDFGDLHVFQTDLLWRIDYYDIELVFGSPDPADPTVTSRVLTVMLETDY